MPQRRAILSIDGGGIRGVVAGRILAAIEEGCGKPCVELFDMICGTSTGGILALGLTKPDPKAPGKPQYAAAQLVDLYRQQGPVIFDRSLEWRIESGNGVLHSKYPATTIERVLHEVYFQETTISEALVDVLITSFDIQGCSGFMFKRSYAVSGKWPDYPMWQAARATSAAPTYFPPLVLPNPEGGPDHILVDGGVCVNDPALCGYAEARKAFPSDPDVLVVSVGTGDKAHAIHRDACEWGLVQWARPILDVVFDGVADSVDYQLKLLCRMNDEPRYHRFQPVLDGSASMDDASAGHIDQLVAAADGLIDEEKEQLDAVCADLTAIAAARTPAAGVGA
jgi:patatin-like phospholipase/acyl hydrolase